MQAWRPPGAPADPRAGVDGGRPASPANGSGIGAGAASQMCNQDQDHGAQTVLGHEDSAVARQRATMRALKENPPRLGKPAPALRARNRRVARVARRSGEALCSAHPPGAAPP
ncbi:hypothetical protein FE772_00450 [Lysobacter enzymogenes]|nr:hypothetical protein [Lysobacter enzymogenes]QCW24362.1 hypothetical protein FE772_00450 [Lysobacter enzymogenes]